MTIPTYISKSTTLIVFAMLWRYEVGISSFAIALMINFPLGNTAAKSLSLFENDLDIQQSILPINSLR